MKRWSNALVILLGLLAASCAKKPTVEDVVKQQVQTQGGAAALAAIVDQVSKWDSRAAYSVGDSTAYVAAEMIITYKRPNQIKFETFNPDGSLASATVFDGAKGWQYGMEQGLREMTAPETEETIAMAEGWIDGFHDYAAKGTTLALLPDSTWEGKRYHVVRATDRFGNVSTNYCDAQTGLVERSEFTYTDPMAMAKKHGVMTFANYTPHAGFMAAGVFRQYDENGVLMFESTLKELQNNAGVHDEAFIPPQPEAPVTDDAMPIDEAAPEDDEQ